MISKLLTDWYIINKRDLPWRESPVAYRVWLSEIILQQTRINQGLSYYLKFVERYPKVDDLAMAPEDEVLKLWQGLGYYSRARNLLKTAREIVLKYNGVFPADYNELVKLKGIGDYTASAIASIAFNLPYPTVDGNVNRLIARLFNIDSPVNSNEGSKLIKEKAYNLLNKKNPGTHNQALMEFGSLYCVPQNPDCENCILKKLCKAYQLGTVNKLPLKEKKVKIKRRYFNYLYIHYRGNTWLQKRQENDIWKNLFEFPLIETPGEVEFDKLKETNEWQELFKGNQLNVNLNINSYTHVLTHQKIHAVFYRIEIDKPLITSGLITVSITKLHKFAIPRLIDKYLQEVNTYE